MTATFKLFADKMGGSPSSEYIGSKGDLFYNQDTGDTRLSDGETAGGTQPTVSSVKFNLNGTIDPKVPGVLAWNSIEDCLEVSQLDNTTLQIGVEQYVQIKNNTGSTILNGTVVQFAGVEDGGNPVPTIMPFIANPNATPLYLIGVLTNDIPHNGKGRVTVFGKVRDLNTTGSDVGEVWNHGDLLWGHPTMAGKMTNVKPTAPNVVTSIAAVLEVSLTAGVILVRPTIFPRLFYGNFYDTTNQTIPVINTPYEVKFNNTDIASGFSVVNNTRITASNSGLYNFKFSLQVTSTNSSASYFWIWYRKNGVDVQHSATKLSISSNAIVLAPSWSFIVSMASNDYFELMWAADKDSVQLSAPVATAFCPATPSATLSVSQVNL